MYLSVLDELMAHTAYSVSEKQYVYQDETLKIPIPNLSSSDVSVSVSGGLVSILIMKDADNPFGCKDRTFRVPRDVDPSKITAKCKKGVLNIEMPKKEEAKTRFLKVS